MLHEREHFRESLIRPLYSFAEADRLAGVTRGTSGRWLKGYQYWYTPDELRTQPPVTPEVHRAEGISFLDLVEVVVVGKLRGKGFSLRRVRQINEYCRLALQAERPLVTEKFRTDGGDVFVMASHGYLLNVLHGAGMQAWEEVLDPFLDTLDYEDELARRWWPVGRGEPVVVDPEYGFGLPVVDGSSVRTEIIAERHAAGDDPDDIAYDFGVSPNKVEAALRFEGRQRAA